MNSMLQGMMGGGMMDGGGMMGPGGNLGAPGNNMVSTWQQVHLSQIIFLDPPIHTINTKGFFTFSTVVLFLQRVSLDLPPMSAVGGLWCHFKLWQEVGEVTRTLFRS